MFTFGLQTFVCVFSDVLIEIFVLHRYFSQYLSLYEVFNVHSLRKAKPLEVSLKLLYQSTFISNAFGSGQLHSFMFLTEWRWRDSNSWPPACKAGALPTELHPHLEYSKFFFLIWQPPAFPYRLQYSIIGRLGLNHRVRDVYGCFPQAHRHQNSLHFVNPLEVASQLLLYPRLLAQLLSSFLNNSTVK